MGKKPKKTVLDVRRALDEAVQADPSRVGLRASAGRMTGFCLHHGEPCCLAGDMLIRLGFAKSRVRQLDGEHDGTPISLADSGTGRYFEPLAFELMCCLQKVNDRGHTWAVAREAALTLDSYWGNKSVKYRCRGRPWLAQTPALNERDFAHG